ncbi:MAG TPA: hypothetical protein VNX68_12285 [Nitrosopumilaceae archaeon]|jgi:hypothetical protein|nr:hypothetical protein [Nitrosopumilaceae archaeon]
MATLKNAIKKAEKLSGATIQIGHNGQRFVNYKGYTVSFYPNGRVQEDVSATCYYTIKNGCQDDHSTDYFAGTHHDNVSQCFSFIDHMTASK